ncbi:MAG: T9SS type A sorting domain-containing protein [Elusimicrobiota bacterium]|nr:MAG: T9SS type A sorting domain-containing protein [Elusimicrobiota bacterium]
MLSAQTDHFSIYQPMAIGVTSAEQDEFRLREHFAYPNPARGGRVTFRFLTGQADELELRVYDVAGRRVHRTVDFVHTAPGGEHWYEHAWSVAGIGSGVYTYVFEARRAGHKPVRGTGRVGVIK